MPEVLRATILKTRKRDGVSRPVFVGRFRCFSRTVSMISQSCFVLLEIRLTSIVTMTSPGTVAAISFSSSLLWAASPCSYSKKMLSAGFLFLDKDGRPKVAMHLENYMRLAQKEYIKQFGNTLPNVTPHVLRHTFCTNAQQAMLDVKSLQYIMGHSTASVTLDVYTHSDFDSAERAFRQIASAL